MTTKAIEAGARAINAHWSEDAGWDTPFDDTEREYQAHCRSTAKSCIEAAIASGELVPASAVAAERERCIQAVRDADGGHFTTKAAVILAIRSLSPEPASGEYVVVPRIPTAEMIEAAVEYGSLDDDDVIAGIYRAMLNAATKDGSGAK